MIVKENPVSNQYHQVYFTFSIKTMNRLFDEIVESHGFEKKDEVKQHKLITKLIMEKIEDEIIEEELQKLDKIPLSSKKYRYLTKVSRDNPLIVICQFCILPQNLQLRFPPFIPADIFVAPFIDEVVAEFTEKILIMHNEYDLVEIEKATYDSVVTYDLAYVQGDFTLSEVKDLTVDLNEDDEESNLFINCKKDDIIILDESDSVNVIAKVTKIHKMQVRELSDEIVKRLNFLNTHTVSEFNKKIADIFTFSTKSIAILNYLVDFVMATGDIEFDEYVMAHFLDADFAPKKKKELESYTKEIKRELVQEYLLTIVNLKYLDEEPRFFQNIIEEYEFDKILFNNPTRIDSYQEYISRRIFETRILEYCIDSKILKL